jgi:hypothetical protein
VPAGEGAARPGAPPAAALALSLDLLGEHLSDAGGIVGTTVVAGAFATEPAGTWRAYRARVGADGPQCFLGLNPQERAAVLLPRDPSDGPAIQALLRALVPAGT